MTERLYQQDSYLKTFTSRVAAVQDGGVILERTAFFPAGGGVLGDEGTLTTADGTTCRVVETVDADGEVLHRLDGPAPAVGADVTGTLDWERRYTLMRYHTATHVLCGVMFNDYSVRVTGNQLTPEKGRVDFSFEAFDRAVLEEGFRKANEMVARDLPVIISWLPAAEAQQRPELFKLETGFRHNLETLRLVEIQGFDVQADGGCHVAHLKEIGTLTLTKSENKGKSNRRVYFVLEG
ncbi:MAG TPA: alanyl-tRNA editing protein [bacterium]|nr:alanyl-tRNA editing protein [bacterium]